MIFLAMRELGQGQLVWCWIKTANQTHLQTNEKIAMLVAGKGWEVGTYVLSAAFYMLLITFTWKQVRRIMLKQKTDEGAILKMGILSIVLTKFDYNGVC